MKPILWYLLNIFDQIIRKLECFVIVNKKVCNMETPYKAFSLVTDSVNKLDLSSIALSNICK
jgi:hypothetical protein